MKDLENTIKYLMKQWASLKKEEQLSLDKVQYSGPIIDAEEYSYAMDAIFNNWWSGGKYTVETERKLAEFSERNLNQSDFAFLCDNSMFFILFYMNEIAFFNAEFFVSYLNHPFIKKIPVFCSFLV